MKFSKIQLVHKKKKTLVKVFYNQHEVSKEGNGFDVEYTKKTNQYMSRSLDEAFQVFKPHLLFGSELAGTEINLDENMDYQKWFSEGHWDADSRFDGVEITEVQFIGNEVLDSVKIKGYRRTQLTTKPFDVKIETPVINLDRVAENHYALVTLLDEHADILLQEIEKYLAGETLTKAQQASLFEIQEAE